MFLSHPALGTSTITITCHLTTTGPWYPISLSIRTLLPNQYANYSSIHRQIYWKEYKITECTFLLLYGSLLTIFKCKYIWYVPSLLRYLSNSHVGHMVRNWFSLLWCHNQCHLFYLWTGCGQPWRSRQWVLSHLYTSPWLHINVEPNFSFPCYPPTLSLPSPSIIQSLILPPKPTPSLLLIHHCHNPPISIYFTAWYATALSIRLDKSSLILPTVCCLFTILLLGDSQWLTAYMHNPQMFITGLFITYALHRTKLHLSGMFLALVLCCWDPPFTSLDLPLPQLLYILHSDMPPSCWSDLMSQASSPPLPIPTGMVGGHESLFLTCLIVETHPSPFQICHCHALSAHILLPFTLDTPSPCQPSARICSSSMFPLNHPTFPTAHRLFTICFSTTRGGLIIYYIFHRTKFHLSGMFSALVLCCWNPPFASLDLPLP